MREETRAEWGLSSKENGLRPKEVKEGKKKGRAVFVELGPQISPAQATVKIKTTHDFLQFF